MTATYQFDEAVVRTNVPEELRALQQWVCWRYTERGGKPTKQPISASTRGAAKSNDESTWSTLDEAIARCLQETSLAGIGFMFAPAGSYTGIDFDNCLSEAGVLDPFVQEALSKLNTYSEISPSGRGVKVIVRAKKHTSRCRAKAGPVGVEIYNRLRFFTFTGRRLSDYLASIEERQAELDALCAQLFSTAPVLTKSEPASPSGAFAPLSDEEVLRRASSLRKSQSKFESLWAGNWEGLYPSQSEADSALVFLLANHTNDAEQIDRLFRRSGLMRPKWDTGYSTRTINKALAMVTEQYDPHPFALEPGEPQPDTSEVLARLPGRSRSEDPGPFPSHLLQVPGFIGEVIAHNLATAPRPQPVLALGAAICLQAVLAGRKVRDTRENRTNIYVISLADSGSGKDHARKLNKRVLFEAGLGKLEGPEDFASEAGLFSAVARQPAILFQWDEFGRFLRTSGDARRNPYLFGVMSTVMKLFTSSSEVFHGKAYSNPNKNLVIDQPCVTILATTAPDHFLTCLTPEMLREGSIARMLLFEGDDLPKRVWRDAKPLPEAIVRHARWWGEFKLGGNLSDVHPDPQEVDATPEARHILEALAETADREHRRCLPDHKPVWARVEEKAARLALIYACSVAPEELLVTEEAATWACQLSEYSTRRLLALANEHVAENEFEARQKRVEAAIRKHGGSISCTDLCRATRWLTPRDRGDVIEALEDAGVLSVISEKTGGRPKVSYVLLRD